MLDITRRVLIFFGAQYLYLCTSSGDYRLLKIGITRKPKNRARQIDESVKGSKERLTMEAVTFGAYRIEQTLHWLFRKSHRPYKGSGRTEYFKIGFLTRLLLCCLLFCLEVISIIFFFSLFFFIGILVINY